MENRPPLLRARVMWELTVGFIGTTPWEEQLQWARKDKIKTQVGSREDGKKLKIAIIDIFLKCVPGKGIFFFSN